MKIKLLILLLCVPFFVCCQDAYVIHVLPGLDGPSGSAVDINNRDDIVGYCETSEGVFHAVLWERGGGVTDLGTLGGGNSWALGINDDGVIVGVSETTEDQRHAFMWQDGTMIDIHDPDWPPINESTARAINNSGLIAGTVGAGGVMWRTPDEVVWVLDGSGLSGPSDAHEINDTHQVVGWHHYSDQAFIWEEGTMEILPHLGIDRSRAYGINNAGQVVGNVTDPDTLEQKAAMWEGDDLPMLLGSLGGSYSNANDINDSDIIVGSAKKPDDATVPFYFKLSEGVMHELMNLGSGIANGVNNGGVIVGMAVNSAGEERPVKWIWTLARWPRE